MSSASDETTSVLTVKYRDMDLRRAGVYIKVKPRKEWPAYVRDLRLYLNVNDFKGVITAADATFFDEVEETTFLHPSSIVLEGDVEAPFHRALSDAKPQAEEVQAYQAGRKEAKWRVAYNEVFAVLMDTPGTHVSDEELWNEPVGPYVSADANLRQSAPDLAFAVQTENQGFATDRVELMTPLSQLFLDLIKEEKQLHPYPTSSNPNYAFPFLVYEAKSDSQPLFYAENQAANGVVKALKMLRGLETEYVNVGGVIDRPLPVIAICSQGSSWEVMIAYFAPSNGTFRRFDMVQIWEGNIAFFYAMFQLHIIVSRIRRWFEELYRPRIEHMLETIRQSFPPSSDPPEIHQK